MNARQVKKQLKRKIERLESDNRIMKRIIGDSPAMAELYNRYTEPVKVVHINNLKQYRVLKRGLFLKHLDRELVRRILAEEISTELIPIIEDNMKVTTSYEFPYYQDRDGIEGQAEFSMWIEIGGENSGK